MTGDEGRRKDEELEREETVHSRMRLEGEQVRSSARTGLSLICLLIFTPRKSSSVPHFSTSIQTADTRICEELSTAAELKASK